MGYLNATLGVAKVPEQEVRKIVGGNAVKLWGFDVEKLQPVVDAYAPTVSEILRIPPEGYIPRGDVNKPFGEVRLSYTAADLGEGKTSGQRSHRPTGRWQYMLVPVITQAARTAASVVVAMSWRPGSSSRTPVKF